MASIRRELRIARPAEQVWELITHPAEIERWFPGIVAATVRTVDDTTVRTVTTGTGVQLEERIVTNDPIARRFQYSITGAAFRSHLATIDVIGLGTDDCLVVYSTDAAPDVMALVLGGATGAALEGIRELALAGDTDPTRSGTAAGDAATATGDGADERAAHDTMEARP